MEFKETLTVKTVDENEVKWLGVPLITHYSNFSIRDWPPKPGNRFIIRYKDKAMMTIRTIERVG